MDWRRSEERSCCGEAHPVACCDWLWLRRSSLADGRAAARPWLKMCENSTYVRGSVVFSPCYFLQQLSTFASKGVNIPHTVYATHIFFFRLVSNFTHLLTTSQLITLLGAFLSRINTTTEHNANMLDTDNDLVNFYTEHLRSTGRSFI